MKLEEERSFISLSWVTYLFVGPEYKETFPVIPFASENIVTRITNWRVAENHIVSEHKAHTVEDRPSCKKCYRSSLSTVIWKWNFNRLDCVNFRDYIESIVFDNHSRADILSARPMYVVQGSMLRSYIYCLTFLLVDS